MNYIFSTLLGIIQGLTEFLPISSSGHLIFLHDILNFNLENNLSFDVALHLGTLVALLIFFGKDVINLIKVWLRSFKHIFAQLAHHRHLIFAGVLKRKKTATQPAVVAGMMERRNLYWEERLTWGILVGTIPAVFVGYYLEGYIKIMFHNLVWVAIALIVVGIFFLIAEKKWQNTNKLDNITIKKAFAIGCAQALALLPGVSRSGITIITGMKQRLGRYSAARFSFLLSIPVVLGAGAKKIIDFIQAGSNSSELGFILVGFIVSAIVGYFCIKYFLKFLQKNPLNIFAYYRFVLGIIILFWVFM